MATAARTIVKKVENAILYSDGTIRIDGVRASFPHLDAPYSKDGDKGKYGITGMLPKATHEAARNLVKKFIDDMMATNKTKVASDKLFLKDGDDTAKEENEGMWLVSANESRAPAVRNRKGVKLDTDEISEMFYGGCWVNILIRPWYQDGQKVGKGFGKRINAGLVGVQFVRDDEPFGEGRISDEDVWDEVEGDDLDFGDDDDL